jgi:hypothetical protein
MLGVEENSEVVVRCVQRVQIVHASRKGVRQHIGGEDTSAEFTEDALSLDPPRKF